MKRCSRMLERAPLVESVWILVEIATVYTFFPETHNRTLEELSFMFEGREAQEKVARGTEKVLQQVEVELVTEQPAQAKTV